MTLITLCSLAFDPGLMHALVIAESDGKPWSFRGSDGEARRFASATEAANAVRDLQRGSASVRIGLAGLVTDVDTTAAQPIEGLFEPCPNIVLASFRLERRVETCRILLLNEPAERCALATYHASFDAPDWAFADAILTRSAVGDLPNPDITRPCDRVSESTNSAPESTRHSPRSRAIFVPLSRDRR